MSIALVSLADILGPNTMFRLPAICLYYTIECTCNVPLNLSAVCHVVFKEYMFGLSAMYLQYTMSLTRKNL